MVSSRGYGNVRFLQGNKARGVSMPESSMANAIHDASMSREDVQHSALQLATRIRTEITDSHTSPLAVTVCRMVLEECGVLYSDSDLFDAKSNTIALAQQAHALHMGNHAFQDARDTSERMERNNSVVLRFLGAAAQQLNSVQDGLWQTDVEQVLEAFLDIESSTAYRPVVLKSLDIIRATAYDMHRTRVDALHARELHRSNLGSV